MWQYIYGGTWSPQEYVDYNTFKHLFCAMASSTLTCWLTVPFDNARRFYYADKTWPLEMRRNYTSPTNALIRVPIEEGLPALFRGGLPIVVNQWLFWTTYMTFYSFIKNKSHFLWTYHDYSYDYIKALNVGFSFGIAAAFSYPAYYVREMVDLWPKERGGHCTWNNSYRNCFRWAIENMDHTGFNYYKNMMHWMRRYGFLYMGSLWMADSLGMFTNCFEGFNSIESQNPIFSEST